MAETWVDTARQAENGTLHWNNIIGPLEATVAVLYMLEWKAPKVHVWTSGEGSRFKLGSLGRARSWKIVEAVEKSAEARVWRKAAKHTFGNGLEEGTPILGRAPPGAQLVSETGTVNRSKSCGPHRVRGGVLLNRG